VRQPRRLWEAYTTAKALGRPPSEIYRIDDEVTAWSFDRAVLTFGSALESRLQTISQKSKNRAEAERRTSLELGKWLRSADPEGSTSGFRDPAKVMSGGR
jgi:hypothetical protein